MLKFVQAPENTRDFAPDLDIECLSLGELNKLELRIEIIHKSNWHNETVRRARRSKFMCALVLALRKVPIYGPGGGDPALGEAGNPRYTVTIPVQMAEDNKEKQAESKDAKRLVPSRSKKAEPQPLQKTDTLASPIESRALETLHERDPALDGTRDTGSSRSDGSTAQGRAGIESGDLEEIRGMLTRQTTKGRRRSVRHPAGYGASRITSHSTGASTSVNMPAPGLGGVPTMTLSAPTPVQEENGYELDAERNWSTDSYQPPTLPAHVARVPVGAMQHAQTR